MYSLSSSTAHENIFLFQVKEEGKKSKRTPSFNIRRRTRSFKDKYKLPENLPPADLDTHLDRKQELQAGGKKATIRYDSDFADTASLSIYSLTI